MKVQALSVVAVCAALFAFRQNPLPAAQPAPAPAAQNAYARATAACGEQAYLVARPLYWEAAETFSAAGNIDSAAIAYYMSGNCYTQLRATDALSAYLEDTLQSKMECLSAPLATALFYQTKCELAFKLIDTETAIQEGHRAYAYFEACGRDTSAIAVWNRQIMSYSSINGGRIDSSLLFMEQALHNAATYHDPCSYVMGTVYLAAGGLSMMLNRLAEADERYTLALQVLQVHLEPNHPKMMTVYSWLSGLKRQQNRPDEALPYVRLALEAGEQGDSFQMHHAAIEYSDLLDLMGLSKEAIVWSDKAVALIPMANKQMAIYHASPLATKAHAAIGMGDTALAKTALTALGAAIEKDPASMFNMQLPYRQMMAKMALDRGDYPSSIETSQAALAFAAANGVDPNLQMVVQLRGDLVEALLLDGQLEAAIEQHQAVESGLGEQLAGATDIIINHELQRVHIALLSEQTARATELMATVVEKLDRSSHGGHSSMVPLMIVDDVLRLYETNASEANGKILLSTAEIIERSLQDNYFLLSEELWTESFVERLRRLYTRAAVYAAESCVRTQLSGVDNQQQGCDLAVRYADLPRALSLRRYVAEAFAEEANPLSDTLRARSHFLRQKSLALRYASMDSTRRANEQELIDKEIAEFESQLRLKHPSYYDAVKGSLNLDVAALRRQAEEQQAIYISYLVDPQSNQVLICAVDKDGPRVALAEHGAKQQAQIADFLLEIGQRQDELLGALGHSLYQRYVEKVVNTLNQEQHLIIAGDGVLAGLPFAALLTHKPAAGEMMNQWSWLGRQYRVSYVDALASAGEVAPQRAVRAGKDLPLACVTPGFERSTSDASSLSASLGAGQRLLRTPWTLALGAMLGERYGAKVLSGELATERAFVDAYGYHAIVHLGTHAFLDEDEPLKSYFALTPTSAERDNDGVLYAYEIYGLDTKARLAVLPACGSGAGRFQSGEGTLSLATAFRNSGCPTVVQSFWSIDDQQTNALLEPFYAELATGTPVATALSSAQRDYLATAPAALQHPYYWAGLAVVGPSVQFEQTRISSWMLLVLAGTLAILGFCYYIYKRQRREAEPAPSLSW